MNHQPKQNIKSPITPCKSPHTSQSSLLDSPIAQLLGFGTSNSQNINLPQVPSINNNTNKNISGNISSSNFNNFFNSTPTFTETKENNDDKQTESHNFNHRLHNFQPPPLLLPNQNLLQPQFIDSPRIQKQEEFLDDFEFYPSELSSANITKNLANNNSDDSIFRYSNLNSSPSPRSSAFDRNNTIFDIANQARIDTNSNEKENSPINRFSSSPTLAKNSFNRNSNKNMINLNLVNSPTSKPYMSSPVCAQNSTFNHKENTNSNNNNNYKIGAKSIALNNLPSPPIRNPTFNLSSDHNDDYSNTNYKISFPDQNYDIPKENSTFDSTKSPISEILGSSTNNGSNSIRIPSIFSNLNRSMLRIENDIIILKKSLNEVHEKYKNKYEFEKEKCRKDIISMIERHREELNSINEKNNGYFNYYQPIIHSSIKSSSKFKNKNRNSNRRFRHEELSPNCSQNESFFSKKQSTNDHSFNIDSIRLGHNSNKVLTRIGFPPPSSTKDNDFLTHSSLKVLRTSGQPTLHTKFQPESIIHVRVQIPNKSQFLHLNDPKRRDILKRQREEIITLNEETSLRLASIIEEATNTKKQIKNRILELSSSKSSTNNSNFVSVSDASSSSSAPSAFCIEDSDEYAKDDNEFIPPDLTAQTTTMTPKYSSSSSSLSSSSFSSSSNLNVNIDHHNANQKNKQKTNKKNTIPSCDKTRNTPQRLLRNIPH